MDYRRSVVAINMKISAQMESVTKVLVEHEKADAERAAAIEATLAEMQRTADAARTIEAPAEVEDAHEIWLRGIGSYDWAAENMYRAVSASDYDLLSECTGRLGEASRYFRTATQMLAQ